MRPPPGNNLILGNLPSRDRSLGLTPKQRCAHLHIVGSSGVGKTKLLENLIRQDIQNWRKSKCGILLLDPHGELYDNLNYLGLSVVLVGGHYYLRRTGPEVLE